MMLKTLVAVTVSSALESCGMSSFLGLRQELLYCGDLWRLDQSKDRHNTQLHCRNSDFYFQMHPAVPHWASKGVHTTSVQPFACPLRMRAADL